MHPLALWQFSICYASHFVCLDSSGDRVLDIGDTSLDLCIDVGAILEGTVAFLIKGAILQSYMVHVAERLLAADVATYELDVLAVPGQILTIQFRIIDGYILAFPETVLGCNLCVVNLYISAVLEYILGVALKSVYIDVLGEHEWISSIVEFYVLQFQAIYLPESLISICDVYVLQIQILHFAEELRPIDGAVFITILSLYQMAERLSGAK